MNVKSRAYVFREFRIDINQLSTHTLNVLKYNRIFTLDALVAHSESELMKLRGFGLKSRNEINKLLKNVRLKPDTPNLDSPR